MAQVINFKPRAQRVAAVQRDDDGPGYLDAKNAVALPNGKPNIIRYGNGLDLWVYKSGLKVWRCKVQRRGKRTTLKLGYFPAMSIKEARKARFDAMTGNDPGQERRDAKEAAAIAEATTFRVVAELWVKTMNATAEWTPAHKSAVEKRLVNHVYPVFGDRPVSEITPTDVLTLVLDLHARDFKATTVMVKQQVSSILDFAWSLDKASCNVALKIKKSLPKRLKKDERSNPYVGTIEDARRVLAAVEKRRGDLSPWTLLVHRLIALTGVRKTEALAARWPEFDLAEATWTIPEKRADGTGMKMGEAHVVALAPQAIELIEAAKRIKTSAYVFPPRVGNRGSKNDRVGRCTLNKTIRRSLALDGLDERMMVPHGWRATFSTIMNEIDEGASFRVVDAMLAHKAFRDSVDSDVRKKTVEGHYNHAQYRSKRHEVACRWADMLLEGAPSALALIGLDEKGDATNVVPFERIA